MSAAVRNWMDDAREKLYEELSADTPSNKFFEDQCREFPREASIGFRAAEMSARWDERERCAALARRHGYTVLADLIIDGPRVSMERLEKEVERTKAAVIKSAEEMRNV